MKGNRQTTHASVRNAILEASTYESAIRNAVHATKKATGLVIDDCIGFNIWPPFRKALNSEPYIGAGRHHDMCSRILPGREPSLRIHLDVLHHKYISNRPNSRGKKPSRWITGRNLVQNLTEVTLVQSPCLVESALEAVLQANKLRSRDSRYDESIWEACKFLSEELLKKGGAANLEIAALANHVSESSARGMHQRLENVKLGKEIIKNLRSDLQTHRAHHQLSRMRLMARKKRLKLS